jgi:predicted AlkP superfamily phosphohydrolase/phosphomutase
VVPGWDDPEETFDSVHPPEAGRDLARVVPKVPRLMNILAADEVVMERIREHLDLRERIARWAVDRVNPHVFVTVFSETDHAAHRWWGEGDPPRELIDVYDLVDRSMGRLMRDLVRDEDTVLIASDHGSWPVHSLVHLAPLLAEAALLRSGRTASAAPIPRRAGPPRRRSRLNAQDGGRQRRLISKLDWPNTRAFPFGDTVLITGVAVNRPPLPFPAVTEDEYEGVRDEVASLLTKVEDPEGGGPAFSTVARREDVYRGPAVDLAPDIVLEGVPGCSPHVGRLLKSHQMFTEVRIGGHRPEGMFVTSSDLGLGEVEPVRDLLTKVLRALGYRFDQPGEEAAIGGERYSAKEAREMEDRLRGLGYME